MADIGSLLRETRIRNKIDITTVEQATKIRAKYLRALENEEWVVLPGPTYVKTFLRTYAQFLGLDPHLLVEEYSARFEEPEELELPAFARRERLPERAVRRVGPPSRAKGALIALAAVVGFLFVLGLLAGEDGGDSSSRDQQGSRQTRTKQADRDRSERAGSGEERSARPRNVRLEVVAARTVWVCVVDARGMERVNAATLEGGDREGPFRSKSFRVTVGNGGGDLRINGRRRDTPDRAEPIGYLVRASGTRVLPADQRPTCG
jgi:cytoskeletal protein RodZ